MAKIKPKGKLVVGTKKNDKITWLSTKDWKRALIVHGGNGNDVINFRKSKYRNNLNGQNGNDTIYGGTNSDTISGGNGNDKLYGYNGNDQIYGGNGNDYIYGENGNDYIESGNGNDVIYGGNGNDSIWGGAGADRIWSGNGNNGVYGGAGNDVIYGGYGNDNLWGGTGNDIIYGTSGTNQLSGGDGNDTIYGGSGVDRINGGAGNDTIWGGEGNDVIYGEEGNDQIWGGNGNDEIWSGEGNDIIYGGNGNDTIWGEGDDQIYGEDGDDIIYDGEGDEYINGGDGNDFIRGYYGNNIIIGGKGNDSFESGGCINGIYLYEGDGQDVISGGGYNTLIFSEGTFVYASENREFNGFSYDRRLVVHYGNGIDQITLLDGDFYYEYNQNLYNYNGTVQNIRIGDTTYSLDHFVNGTPLSITRGTQQNGLNLDAGEMLCVTLDSHYSFHGGYVYRIVSKVSQSINLNFLSNGRFRIEGNDLIIMAGLQQSDDLIIWGNNNTIYSKDFNDIIRLGGATDSGTPSDFVRESRYNTVCAGDGNDYVVYFGNGNTIDGEDGDDMALAMGGSSLSGISSAFVREEFSNIADSADGVIGWFNQGYEGGDCRLLSLILGLSNSLKATDGSYSDYVTITQNSNTYTVSFNNYNHAGNWSEVQVTENEVADFHHVFGDLDVVLTDLALNKIIAHNQDHGNNSVTTARYNTLADYFFGNENMTFIQSSEGVTYSTRLNELWNMYSTQKTINNLTIAINGDNDFELGIVGNHAYTPVGLTAQYISLVNVWDSQDILKLDLDTFYNLDTAAFVYGYDIYNQPGLVINNGGGGDCPYLISEINQEVIGWQEGYSCADIQPACCNDMQTDYLAINSLIQENLV